MTLYSRDASGAVEIQMAHTDPNGRAEFSLKPDREYLVDAVLMRKPGREVAAEHRVM